PPSPPLFPYTTLFRSGGEQLRRPRRETLPHTPGRSAAAQGLRQRGPAALPVRRGGPDDVRHPRPVVPDAPRLLRAQPVLVPLLRSEERRVGNESSPVC